MQCSQFLLQARCALAGVCVTVTLTAYTCKISHFLWNSGATGLCIGMGKNIWKPSPVGSRSPHLEFCSERVYIRCITGWREGICGDNRSSLERLVNVASCSQCELFSLLQCNMFFLELCLPAFAMPALVTLLSSNRRTDLQCSVAASGIPKNFKLPFTNIPEVQSHPETE